MAEDAVLAVPAKGVLANDTDVHAGATLSVTAVENSTASVGSAITLASGAKVTMQADGSYMVDTNGKYGSLAAGETVTESFSYTVSDDAGGSATGKATLTIAGANDAPTVQGASRRKPRVRATPSAGKSRPACSPTSIRRTS